MERPARRTSERYIQSLLDANHPYIHAVNVTLVRPDRTQTSVVIYPGPKVNLLTPPDFTDHILGEIEERFPELARYSELELYWLDREGNRKDLLRQNGDVMEYLTEMILRREIGHLYVEGVNETAIYWKHVVGAVALIGLFGGIKSFWR